MKALIVTAVLGLGTAIVFGAAALTATLFPNGSTVALSWMGGGWAKGGGIAVPVPAPAVNVAPFVVDDSGSVVVPDALGTDGGVVITRQFQAMPGDTVQSGIDAPTLAPTP